jgi:3'-phosphoadenosine 5'-phosphosulfate sulfotransferase (PAPS reductase)/FAD synthetase
MIEVHTHLRSAQEIVAKSIEEYGRDLAVCTSFQKTGAVILDLALRIDPTVRVFTLDTGRLPDETYHMMEMIRVEAMVTRYGPNLFRREVPLRMLCCKIRKVRPLGRKLKGFRAYMVGLRRGQNPSRAALPLIDRSSELVKISPLLDWSRQEVDEYIAENDLAIHPLYEQGYASIGCGPCTRATLPGEDERAGRWWWEAEAEKECGIHFTPDGKAERTVDVLLRELVDPAEDFELGFDPGL